MKHDQPLTEKPAGPAGTGPQEPPVAVPPGVVQYEVTDVKTRSITKALAVLVVASVVVVALLLPLFLWLRGRAQRSDPPAPPMGRREAGRLPAEPRLQTRPVQDLAALRVEDERLLASYGWVDEARGIVHIPIEEAMRLLAERGLPAAGTAATPGPVPAAAPSPGGQR